MSFPAYESYKDSGVEWLGRVPSHWSVLPCRAIVDERNIRNDGGTIQSYLSLMANVGVIPYEEKGDVGNKKPDDLEKCKIVCRGDLVINSMNYGIGSYGISGLDGVCSPVYIVLRPKLDVIEERFSYRVFQNRAFQTLSQSFGNGILAHRSAINWDIIKVIHVAVPSKSEQIQILSFLDREIGKIDALVAEQTRLIELLEEKRQTVISHAVTKGLDPNAPMKDSGVEWLGEVPEHWDVLTFRRVLSKIEQGWSPQCESRPAESGEAAVIKLSAISGGKFRAKENKAFDPNEEPDQRFLIRTGDFLLTRANTPELVGECCVVSEDFDSLLMLPDLVYRLTIDVRLEQHFLRDWLRSYGGRFGIMLDARGSSMTMAKISQEHIKQWVVPVPPQTEQLEIEAYLEAETIKFEELISAAQNAISLLQERRSALVSAAVTGKIDVRGLVQAKAEAA